MIGPDGSSLKRNYRIGKIPGLEGLCPTKKKRHLLKLKFDALSFFWRAAAVAPVAKRFLCVATKLINRGWAFLEKVNKS